MATNSAEDQRLRDLALLRRVKDRMDREYDQPLDVAALAQGVGMSSGHLSRQFREAYGEPPYSYLMTRRIERAMALLRRGDMSVTDVCFAVGCSSLGTFSTRFTELVGVSPSVYKRDAVGATEGMIACVAKKVTRPVRERGASAMSDLKGRTFLVSGANTGIGKETARVLAGRGARVVLAGRSEEKTRAAMKEIADETGNTDLDYVALDLGDLASVQERRPRPSWRAASRCTSSSTTPAWPAPGA